MPTRDSDRGLQVNVGVRPEDLSAVEDGAPYIFEGTVNITEALGEVTLLYFDRIGDNDAVIGKLPGIHQGLRGQTVRMTAQSDKVQIFHNGQSLHYR